MSKTDEDLASLVAELVRSLRELQRELEPGERRRRGPPRPPTPGELAEFTSEVAIPGAVLLLETNVRALRLLQRALRLAADRETETDGPRERPLADRAAAASGETLSRLDDVLAELQAAVEGRPTDDEARELLAEARRLREDVQTRLDERVRADAERKPDGEDADVPASDAESSDETVEVDVEAELASIQDELDGSSDGENDETGDDTDVDSSRGDDTDVDSSRGDDSEDRSPDDDSER